MQLDEFMKKQLDEISSLSSSNPNTTSNSKSTNTDNIYEEVILKLNKITATVRWRNCANKITAQSTSATRQKKGNCQFLSPTGKLSEQEEHLTTNKKKFKTNTRPSEKE